MIDQSTRSPAQSEFKAGWHILLVSLVGVITSAGVAPLYSFGALVTDMSTALGHTPGELQRCITFAFIGLAVGSQLVGWLLSKYGVRRVTLYSLAALSLLYMAVPLVELNLWLMYLFYFLFPVIGCGSLHISWTQVTCQWFEKNRGMALAIILSGTGLSSMVLPIAITYSSHLGDWQWGFFILGILPLLTLVLCYKWMYEPESPALKPMTEDIPAAAASFSPGYSFRESFRMRTFWLICTALALVVCGILAMVTNLVPLLRHHGWSAAEAASVYSAFGLSLILGRLGVGYLLDRLWAPLIAFITLLIPSIGCLILLQMPPQLYLLVVAAALIGIGAGAEYDIASYIVTRYFGLKEYSKIFGTMMGVTTAGFCMAPFYYGFLIDHFGGYQQLLMSCVVFFVVGSSLFLILGPYPYFKSSTYADQPGAELPPK
jgi:MFS family permease